MKTVSLILSLALALAGCGDSGKAENQRLKEEISKLENRVKEFESKQSMICMPQEHLRFGKDEDGISSVHKCFDTKNIFHAENIKAVLEVFNKNCKDGSSDCIVHVRHPSSMFTAMLHLATDAEFAIPLKPDVFVGSLRGLSQTMWNLFPALTELGIGEETHGIHAAYYSAQAAVLEKARAALAKPTVLRAAYAANRTAIHAAMVREMDPHNQAGFVADARKAADAFKNMRTPAVRDCVGALAKADAIDDETKSQACLAKLGAGPEVARAYGFAWRRFSEGGDDLLAEYHRIAADVADFAAGYAKLSSPTGGPAR